MTIIYLFSNLNELHYGTNDQSILSFKGSSPDFASEFKRIIQPLFLIKIIRKPYMNSIVEFLRKQKLISLLKFTFY